MGGTSPCHLETSQANPPFALEVPAAYPSLAPKRPGLHPLLRAPVGNPNLAVLFLRLGFPTANGPRHFISDSFPWGCGVVWLPECISPSTQAARLHNDFGTTMPTQSSCRSPSHRVWRGSVFSYVFWRHGIPWGVSNGIINAFLAVPFFPGNPGDGQDIASPLSISLDIFFTSLILCFVVSLSAAPHALVDTRLGLISASESAYSPARKGWVGWFLLFSVGVALGTMVGLKAVGIEGLVVRWFIPWKGLAAGAIAGIAATISAYWTLAGETAAKETESVQKSSARATD